MRSRILLLLAVLSMALVLSKAVLAQNIPQLEPREYIIEPARVEPGDYFDIYLKIQNLGDEAALNPEASLEIGYPERGLEIVQGHQELGKIDPGGYSIARFRVRALPNASEGVYELIVTLRYRDEEGGEHESQGRIRVTVTGRPWVTVRSEGDLRLEPGEASEITLVVENEGTGLARSVELEIQSSSGISPIGSGSFYAGDLEPGESVRIPVRLEAERDLGEGTYQIPIKLSYTVRYPSVVQNVVTPYPGVGSESIQRTETYTEMRQERVLSLSVRVLGRVKLSIGSVETDPREIRSGDDKVQLCIGIQNIGTADAENAVAKILENDIVSPSFSSSDLATLGIIDRGEEKRACFLVDIAEGLAPGSYTIPILVEYTHSGDVEKSLLNLTIRIEGKPDLRITKVETIPDRVSPGDKVLMRIWIKNEGHEEAENVEISAMRKPTQPLDFERRTDYIGSLKPGEEGIATVEFEVKKDAKPKKYQVEFLIRCTGNREEGDTNVYTFERYAEFEVSGRPARRVGGDFRLVLGVIAGFLLGFGIAYQLGRR